MQVQHSSEDLLQHIDGGQPLAHTGQNFVNTGTTSSSSSAKISDEELLQSATSDGCITLLSYYGASIKVCYDVKSSGVDIKVELCVPAAGCVTIGKAEVSKDHGVKIGGGLAGFKAEVEIKLLSGPELKICGTICAPLAGCKQGCTSINL